MNEPLTIYVCSECGEQLRSPLGHAHRPGARRIPTQEVPVFRETDVRPLWQAAARRRRGGDALDFGRAIDAFPAPEDWR